MIQILRIYINSGLEYPVLINPRYCMKIESTLPEEDKPKTRIVMEGYSNEGPSFIYTNETLATIKAKISKSRK